MRQLIWFRNDLRLHDNTALTHAMASGPTLALFLITPGQWQAHGDAANKVDFWLRNLSTLSAELARLNVPLLIRQVEHWKDAAQCLADVCAQHQVTQVHANREYGINEQQRDQQVRRHLQDRQVAWRDYLDQLLFDPGTIQTRNGTCPQVYGQFRKQCLERLHHALPASLPCPPGQAPLTVAADPVPGQVRGFDTPSLRLQQYWPAGEQPAFQALETFRDNLLADYDRLRDYPAQHATSRLSPYLASGVLSPRQCLHAVLACNHGELEGPLPGAGVWLNEVLWREFYKHILVAYPQVCRHRAFRQVTEQIAWRQAPEQLTAWQEGRTGFPLIDAAMQQLRTLGWMHNRLRMVVAMFLSKNLLIDWREGERFFMAHLIDGDLAANNGGWQWSASTGTDAVPYFRVFNPVTQSQRFDPKGEFIREWLPQLSHLDAREIHEPWRAGGLFGVADYPAPIVDLKQSRERAIQAFDGLRDIPHG